MPVSTIGYRSGVRAGCWGSGEERSAIWEPSAMTRTY
jgi:hypothetical protein